MIDPFFKVSVISSAPYPQLTVWRALRQDYSEDFVADLPSMPEQAAGLSAVKNLLNGNRGHFGPLEHPAIVFNAGFFPHSLMQQARTHRVGTSFDVQSGRYTGNRVLELVKGNLDLEQVFYLRPIGSYDNRQGKKYDYTEALRNVDKQYCFDAAERYSDLIENYGLAEEHAREILPFCIRQHFVVSFNARSLMHFLDLRAKLDAQLEIRQLCELIMPHFHAWMPEIASWYEKNRWGKARLAP